MTIDWQTPLSFNQATPELKTLSGPSLEAVLQGYDHMEKDLDQAENCRLFDPLPTKEPVTAPDVARIRTIRNRLFLLGYLEKDSQSISLDLKLKDAIRKFQTESNLTCDGWVGNQTWEAMQELIGFETPTQVDKWLVNDKPLPAFNRAIVLRLKALGLTLNTPVTGKESIKRLLQKFVKIAELLNFKAIAHHKKTFQSKIELLFDQDALLDGLAQAKVPQSHARRLEIHGFILSVAKIELWLAGYPVRPTGADLDSVTFFQQDKEGFYHQVKQVRSTLVGDNFELKADTPLSESIVQLLRDNGYKFGKALQSAESFLTFFPAFFSILSQASNSKEDLPLSEKMALIQETIEKQPDKIQDVWTQVKKIGARIWDGIKRVWNWIKRLVSRAIEIGKNITRLIYAFGQKSFTLIRKAIRATTDAIAYFLNPVVPGSDLKIAAAGHKMDFDFKLFINQAAAPEKTSLFFDRLKSRSRIFAAMCRLLSIFLNILLQIPKALAGGWVGLIWALIKLFRNLGDLKDAFSDYKKMLQSYVY